ncbi:hypothetical protein GcM1_239005 [Golovinomyces cichoracearum]|uniref:Uncharacterized protein n=1 Tax=Golovinomyces cichoracearum TaxID=62708 RepID=A0A420III0_9PEZI|nr:hypothetical protein GcM1_239005 [Golovinomyces cichoracearum]
MGQSLMEVMLTRSKSSREAIQLTQFEHTLPVTRRRKPSGLRKKTTPNIQHLALWQTRASISKNEN